MNASHIKTSLKQKRKTTTTTSESRISVASGNQPELLPKKEVMTKQISAAMRISFGRTEYRQGAYQ
jgi:hypothetical protein